MADEHLRTVRRLAGGDFDILGELGREQGGRVAYVARESPTGELVVLTLEGTESAAGGGADPSLAVRRTLDASVPGAANPCPACGELADTWTRHCPRCGHDLSGGPPPVSDKNTGRMLAQTVGGARYDLYGDMERSEGGAPVYFGRDQTTDELVALRLEPNDDPDAPVPFTLTVSQRMPALSPGDVAASSSGGAGRETGESPPRTGARVYVCPTCGGQYPPGTFVCPKDGAALRLRGMDLVGRTIAGRYRIVERLGQGGMGQVYRAEHIRMGSSCAIKIMNPALEQDPEAMGRFSREATHASRIDHPNVARVFDFGETQDGLLFLAMEFVEGETLQRIVEKEGPLEPSRAARIGWQIADALQAAHSHGTVHRDIKPDNIIIKREPDGRELAKIVDFGIARMINVAEGEQVTRAGFVVGNPKYMSPEQLAGEAVDARTDIYSLGCVLYEMLVGKPAFGGASGPALAVRRLTQPPPSPRESRPGLPRNLDDIVVRAMAREPGGRFESAAALRDALEPAIETPVTGRRRIRTGGRGGAVTRATSDTAERERAPGEPRKLRAWQIGVAAAAVVAVALFGILRFGGWGGPPAGSEPEQGGQAGAPIGPAGDTASAAGDDTTRQPGLAQAAGPDSATRANARAAEPPTPLAAGARGGAAAAESGAAAPGRQADAGAVGRSDSLAAARRPPPDTPVRVIPPPDTPRQAIPPPDTPVRVIPPPDSTRGVAPPSAAGGQQVREAFDPAAADSLVAAQLDMVDLQDGRHDYAEAFRIVFALRDRVDTLNMRFPGQPVLDSLGQRVQDKLTSLRDHCEAWADVVKGRNGVPPVCR